MSYILNKKLPIENCEMWARNKPFKLFASCIPVKGIQRSIICDVQRYTFDFIPNGLYDILTNYEGQTIETVKEVFSLNEENIIDEYFSFLIEKEYVFLTNHPKEEWSKNPLKEKAIKHYKLS